MALGQGVERHVSLQNGRERHAGAAQLALLLLCKKERVNFETKPLLNGAVK